MKFFFSICFFFILGSSYSAIFNSLQDGNYSSSTSWSFVPGSAFDADGIPDANDTIVVQHIISIVSSSAARRITIDPSGTIKFVPNNVLVCYGDFTNNGTVSGTGTMTFRANTGNPVITSASTISASLILFVRPQGNTITFSAGTVFSNINTMACDGTGTGGGTVNNLGNLRVTNSFQINSGVNFVNGNNSFLTLYAGVNLISGTFNATANPNTVSFTTGGYSSVFNTAYHHLQISNGTGTSVVTKNLTGNLVVAGNLTINSNVALNCNNFNITIGGNWIHTGTSSAGNLSNLGTVTFNGTAQTITRGAGLGTEVLKSTIVNSSSSLTLGSNLQCSNLTLNSGTFDLSASNFTCNLTGDLAIGGAGLINARSGKFRFVGSAAQTISGAGTPTFYDFISRNNAGVSVTASISVSNLLTDSLGQLATSGAGQIRLAANSATNYGRIGPVVGSLAGTGWVVESFVSPGPANWTWLSTPMNGNLLSDWDNDARFYMSGIGGNDGNACCPVFYSVRTYNTSNNTYTNITSKNHALVRGRGYRVYMSDNMTSLTSALVYNSVGTPNFLAVPSPTLTAGGTGNGWNLVGNPYACPIDFSTLAAANSNINSSGFMILQDNGSYATNPNSGVISPNQGFMVNANASGGTVNFTENCKNTSALPNLIRVSQPLNQIKAIVSNDFNGLGSETSIGFVSGATDEYDNHFDLPYLSNIFEEADNIWTEVPNSGEKLILNQFGVDNLDRIIDLNVKPGVYGKHTLSFSGLSSLSLYNCIRLEEGSTGSGIDLMKISTYDFLVSDTSKVYVFRLHLENQQECLNFNNQSAANQLLENTKVFNNGNGVVVKFGFSDNTPVTINVFNAIGQEVIHTQTLMVSQDLVPLSVPEGNQIYFVTIRSGDKILTRKIVN